MRAGAGHARARDLGEAVDVVGDDARLAFDRLAHFVRPRFGAEDAVAELRVAPEVDALLLRLVHDAEEVGGRRRDGGHAEVAHEHDLALGVAARDGQHGAAESLAAVVEAEAAGEESVAVGDLDHVARADAVHREAAHRAVLPNLNVLYRVRDADGFARGARGAVEADDFVHRRAAEAHRVLVAEIHLLREGQQLDVGERLDVLGPHAALLAALAEEGHALVGVLHRPLEAVQLERAEGFDGHVVHRRHGMRRRVDIMRKFWIDHAGSFFCVVSV